MQIMMPTLKHRNIIYEKQKEKEKEET